MNSEIVRCASFLPGGEQCDEYAPPAEAFLLANGFYSNALAIPLCVLHRVLTQQTIRRHWHAMEEQEEEPEDHPSHDDGALAAEWAAVTAWANAHNGLPPRYDDFKRTNNLPDWRVFKEVYGGMDAFYREGVRRGAWADCSWFQLRTDGDAKRIKVRRFSEKDIWNAIAQWMANNSGRIPAYQDYGQGVLPSFSILSRRYGGVEGILKMGLERGAWDARAVRIFRAQQADRKRQGFPAYRKKMVFPASEAENQRNQFWQQIEQWVVRYPGSMPTWDDMDSMDMPGRYQVSKLFGGMSRVHKEGYDRGLWATPERGKRRRKSGAAAD